ncbi:thiamine diphosphokinase [Paenisporosarcina quisquiliarum]|uniref:thiamine diphosphokinase n=1 Tax=Paenisporosarcina quisquiliarum TaxID=365346 RepID=UPI00373505BC
MRTVVICGGGPKNELMSFQSYSNDEDIVFIGADRGAITLLELGLMPTEAVGDFDSLSSEELMYLQQSIKSLNPVSSEKDETDAELAIAKALTFKPTHIVITGVTGGRLDHFMAVLNSVYRFQTNYPHITFKIVNKWNELFLLSAGDHELVKNKDLPYVSFFSFQGIISNVTLTGFKYDVAEETIELGNARFTSNELLYEVGSISFTSGICLVIRSSDE